MIGILAINKQRSKGKRGETMPKGSRGGSEGGGSASAPALNKDLVRRANEAGTFVDYGDATSRQYNKNVAEIADMDMTAAERKSAYTELHSLTEKQLEVESQARGAYAAGVGPARIDRQAIQRNQSKALSASDNVRSFMEGLRKEQAEKVKARERKALTDAYNKALAEGALSFTVNGKTWTRKTKRGKTFTSN